MSAAAVAKIGAQLIPGIINGISQVSQGVRQNRRRRNRQRIATRKKQSNVMRAQRSYMRSRQPNQPVRRNYRMQQTNLKTGSNRNSTIVTHREIVAPVLAAATYNCGYKDINPGLTTLCAYGSNFAKNYSQYSCRKITVHYTPQVSGTQPGQVALNIFPDPTENKPLDLADFQNQSGAQYGSVTSPLTCTLSSAVLNRKTRLFVRSGNFTGDKRLWDIGRIFIAVDGVTGLTAQDVIGQLSIDYSFEFFNTKMSNGDATASFIEHTNPASSVAPLADFEDLDDYVGIPDFAISDSGCGIKGNVRGWYHVSCIISTNTGTVTASLNTVDSYGFSEREAHKVNSQLMPTNIVAYNSHSAYFSGEFNWEYTIAATDIRNVIITFHKSRDHRDLV